MSLREAKRRSNLKTHDCRLPRRISDNSQGQIEAHLLNTIDIISLESKLRIQDDKYSNSFNILG